MPLALTSFSDISLAEQFGRVPSHYRQVGVGVQVSHVASIYTRGWGPSRFGWALLGLPAPHQASTEISQPEGMSPPDYSSGVPTDTEVEEWPCYHWVVLNPDSPPGLLL